MAITLHLRLTGKAEKFIKLLMVEGLTEADILARALSILEDVWRIKRVGVIAKGFEKTKAVEYLYGINITEEPEQEAQPVEAALAAITASGEPAGRITFHPEKSWKTSQPFNPESIGVTSLQRSIAEIAERMKREQEQQRKTEGGLKISE
jgi:hypothetical protein